VAIQHFVGDRGVFSALNRLLLQRVQAYYDPRFGPDLGPSRALLGLTDWSLGTACSLHDAQNALKWSLAPHSAGGTLDNLHIAVESVRNTYVPLHSHIGGFLLGHLRFAEAEHDVDDAACVWRYVGVEAHMVQVLSELNPVWKDGYLYVSPSAAQDADLMPKLSEILSFLFKFRKATDSRWTSIGASSRALLANLLVGLDGIVEDTLADEKVIRYHLHGYDRCNAEVRRFVVVACGVAYATDSFITEVLSDDRVLRRHDELKTAVT
jgi:hypothetical protein